MMRKVKLFFRVVLSFTLALTLGACSNAGGGIENTLTPEAAAPVESIRIINAESKLSPGDFAITAKCFPEGSDSLYIAELETKTAGVKLSQSSDGFVLKVGNNAPDGATVSVRVSSVGSPKVSDTHTFTLSVPEVEYVPIRTEDQLRAIGASPKALIGNYKLANDIKLEREWKPIGSVNSPFNGLFNGGGYSITNISMAYGADSGNAAGFFGKLGEFAKVSNVGFNGRDVKASMNMADNCGVVAGINNGVVENVFTDVNIIGGGFAAGLVGVNSGTISNSYALGATTSNSLTDKGGVVGSNVEGTINDIFADAETTKLTTFFGAANEHLDNLNSQLLTTSAMKTAATFNTWDTSVWHLQDGFYPMLINDEFTAPQDARRIAIVNPYDEIDVSMFSDGYVAIQTRRANAPNTTIEYSMSETIAGVTLDSFTGVLHFDNLAADGQKITVTAKLSGTEISDSKEFSICNDGYNPYTGLIISTEEELYGNLIVKDDKTNEVKVGRNMKRNLKLGGNIELSSYKAWPGVKSTFEGSFNGNGYTISGLDVPNSVATDGYGFFMNVNTALAIENLGLEGKVVGKGKYVAALVKNLVKGTIRNVKVNVDLDTDNTQAGKIIGNLDKGGTAIENSIAMGHMGTSVEYKPPQTDDRPNWAPYALGGLLGYTLGPIGSTGVKNNAVLRYDGDNAKDVGVTIRPGNTIGETSVSVNTGFVTIQEFITAKTFTDKSFNTNIWYLEDGYEPMLKYSGFVAPEKPSYISITNTEESHNLQEMTDGQFQITVNTINDKGIAPVYSLETPVTGVSIDSSMGMVTITDDVINDAKVCVIAKLPNTDAVSRYRFFVIDDGYIPSVGITISTEAELYDNLIVNADKTNATKVKLNMTRNLKLGADITLTDNPNWPGVEDTFSGSFDGKGHTISGINAVINSNKPYGFFKQVNAPGKTAVQRLGLQGSVVYTATNPTVKSATETSRLGGLVGQFMGGTIKNVLVNMEITSNTRYCGGIVGFIKGGSVAQGTKIEGSFFIGTVRTTLPYSSPNNDSVRPTWEPFACGALAGKAEAGAFKPFMYNVLAYNFPDRDVNDTRLTTRTNGDSTNAEGAELNGCFWRDESWLKGGNGNYNVDFDRNAWNFEVGQWPALKPIA